MKAVFRCPFFRLFIDDIHDVNNPDFDLPLNPIDLFLDFELLEFFLFGNDGPFGVIDGNF